MKIGILGSGAVAQALGGGLGRHGHEVMLGTRDRAKLADFAAGHPGAQVGSFAEAATFGEIVVLAVKGTVAGEAIRLAGHDAIAGKVVIDATNPIAEAPPQDGVLALFTGPNDSLLERLQAECPAGRFVKAFSCVGAALMIDPDLPGGPPTMFICGNDAAAKSEVSRLLDSVGWEVMDMGGAKAARAIEPLCVLWCLPGFQRNEWRHAFKMLR